MTTPPAADGPRSALELIAEAIGRVRSTDPTDTAAALLAAWHGFGAAEAAGRLLAADSLDDGVLARNARAAMRAVEQRLRVAPSLPYTDLVTETIEGLVPAEPAVDRRSEDHADQLLVYQPDQFEVVDRSPAGVVRRGIVALALELNMLLPVAAEHAHHLADRKACQEGTALAYELSCCWEGRLGSFLNASLRGL